MTTMGCSFYKNGGGGGRGEKGGGGGGGGGGKWGEGPIKDRGISTLCTYGYFMR